MIPLHDDIPTGRIPVLTIALIVACVVGLLYTTSLPDDARRGSQTALFCSYGAVPANILDHSPDTAVGVPADALTCYGLSREQGRFTGLVSHMFLHAGWIHLVGNMLFLWVFGNNVEDRLGRLRFVPFYLGCGVIAALAQSFTEASSDIPMIGASGAVSAMLGAYVVLYPRARIWTLVLFVIPMRLPALLWIGLYFVGQFVSMGKQLGGSGTDTAYVAHVVGFIAGAALITPALAGRRHGTSLGASPAPPT